MGRVSLAIRMIVGDNTHCPHCGTVIDGHVLHLPTCCDKNPGNVRKREISNLPEHLKKYATGKY